MSRRTKPTARPADSAQTVYFAFGSNLHLGQMAKRCPESRYLGRGALRGFEWQINTRGYANIFESPSNTVEGLCFLLSTKDEERLDRSEGVNMVPRAYEKGWVNVSVYSSNPLIVGRRVHEVDNFIHQMSSTSFKGSKRSKAKVKALVYLSSTHTSDGPPKTEYISRMQAGIEDAILLGVPDSYFTQKKFKLVNPGSPATESVPKKQSLQDQQQETTSGEDLRETTRPDANSEPTAQTGILESVPRNYETRREFRTYSSDRDFGERSAKTIPPRSAARDVFRRRLTGNYETRRELRAYSSDGDFGRTLNCRNCVAFYERLIN